MSDFGPNLHCNFSIKSGFLINFPKMHDFYHLLIKCCIMVEIQLKCSIFDKLHELFVKWCFRKMNKRSSEITIFRYVFWYICPRGVSSMSFTVWRTPRIIYICFRIKCMWCDLCFLCFRIITPPNTWSNASPSMTCCITIPYYIEFVHSFNITFAFWQRIIWNSFIVSILPLPFGKG